MIVEYSSKYLEDVKDLLVELEEYLVSIDQDNLDQIHSDYRDKMAIVDLNDIKNNNGKCYLTKTGRIPQLLLNKLGMNSAYFY